MTSLKRILDLEPASWISEGLHALGGVDTQNWEGNFVSHCLPTAFAAYCKVFHPIYEDRSIEDRELTWNDVDRQRPRDPNDPIDRALGDATTVYGGEFDPDTIGPISWRDLAKRYGLEFHAEMNADSFTRNFPGKSWPRYLMGPAEGNLELDTLKAIVRALATVTEDYELLQPCYFHYDLIATGSWDGELLFEGKLIDVFDSPGLEDVNTTPTHWWPKCREWLITSDWDLTFTLIGGSLELINSLVWDSEIDCVRVEPTTRIDYRSDQMNP